MKEIKNKYARYTAAVGALLAIAPAANAVPVRGTILPGSDGNTTLSDTLDFVGIDINNDGNPDFVAYMYSDTTFGTISNGPPGISQLKLILLGAYPGNFIDQTTSIDPVINSSSFFISGVKKFLPGDQIGPLAHPNSLGLLGIYSKGDFPDPVSPPTSPFYLNDEGFVGVSLPSGSGNNYGWIQVLVEPDADIQIIDCAMESLANAPIAAGSTVPILPIASALGLGLVGLAAYLKGKKKRQII